MQFNTLPFVKCDETGHVISTWTVESSGDYSKDCATGRHHFDQLLRAIDASGNLLLLSRVIEGQVKAGHWSGIEIGFTQAMAERVL